eukprot:CAMPEP_0177777112 /NCGR_PEP_ID=MMETSP0491_2-20121128/15118_1 /TAXON_ID=63592 /ORGANISM="Tetraselmis chuii, Strain PLY429" /LENGTH=112 /DNA_ID=CAMNT_0019296039 /DNA_START=1 /DNA_END=337 /DNA_ORIENTATION=+
MTNISELRLIHLCGLSACSPSSSAKLEASAASTQGVCKYNLSFRRYKNKSLGRPPCDGVDWKGIMKELRQETGDRRSAEDASAVPDRHGFIAAFGSAQMRERRAFSEAQRMR